MVQTRGEQKRLRTQTFLVDVWLPTVARTVRRSTAVTYAGHVHKHIVPALGRKWLEAIEPTDVNALYERLSMGMSDVTPTTIRRIHVTLHRALGDAVRWGYVATNVAAQANPPRARAAQEMETWSVPDLRRFLDVVAGDSLRTLWVVLSCTGLRRGEALGLRRCDVDLERAELAVRQTVISVAGEVLLSEPKTKRGRRVVALDDYTTRALRAHVASISRRGPAIRTELLFRAPDGRPLDPPTVSRRFRQLAREAGLPQIRLHDLRHTHATIALQAGVHPKIVSERLGHANISITLDTYSHALPHLQHEAAAAISHVVLGGAGL